MPLLVGLPLLLQHLPPLVGLLVVLLVVRLIGLPVGLPLLPQLQPPPVGPPAKLLVGQLVEPLAPLVPLPLLGYQSSH